MRIRTVVADDQPLARERLRALLADEPDIDVVAVAATGPAAVHAVRERAPDLVFLDIRMPELDGVAVVETIGVERMPYTVFVTAFDAYAVKAFELHAVDYLLKPFGRHRLQATLARVRQRLALQRTAASAARLRSAVDELTPPTLSGGRLLIRARGRVSFVAIEAIDWIEAEGNYVRIHAEGVATLVRDTLSRLHERLADPRFVRIHRSCVVNADRVTQITVAPGGDYNAVLTSGVTLRLSRLYRGAFEERLAAGR